MFFVYLTFILHIYKSLSSSDTETRLRHPIIKVYTQPETIKKSAAKKKSKKLKKLNSIKKEITDCCYLLHQKFPMFQMTEFFDYEAKEIAKNLFNLVMDNINFPIRKNTKEILSMDSKYFIHKKDINYELYYALLRNENSQIIHDGEEKDEIFKFTRSLAKETRNMYETLLCIDFNVFRLSMAEISLYIDKHMTIKMGKRKKYIVKKVFVSDDYLIAKNIKHYILPFKNDLYFSRLNQDKNLGYANGKVMDPISYERYRLSVSI
ncbi:uncharacterized protein VNE69_06163 [Vairimorpha necatrix]|uniref:Uncharacterized protein n=1 Tax=Vairimorpha necatrix TaxID=6039 RepID=A0AAX4JCW2_9MICR